MDIKRTLFLQERILVNIPQTTQYKGKNNEYVYVLDNLGSAKNDAEPIAKSPKYNRETHKYINRTIPTLFFVLI